MNKIIFLDRDGIINKKPKPGEYILRTENFELLPGAIEGLRLLSSKKFEIFIITNQPGIGRGFMTENDLKEIHELFISICKKNNIRIKGIYSCPHNRDARCECRKPKPGLLMRAAKKHGFDITHALFIGDDVRDKQAGDAVGCKTFVVPPDGNLLDILQKII